MKQQTKQKKAGLWQRLALLLLLELVFFYLVQLIVPSCNVLVEKVDNHYVGYVNDREGYRKIEFSEAGIGQVHSELYHIDETVEIDIPEERAKASVPVTFLNLERLHPNTYRGMYDVVLHNALPLQAALFFFFNLCLAALILFAKKKKFSLAAFASCFHYRSEKQVRWGKKQWLLLGLAVLASFAIAPGVDLPSITRMSSQFVSGGDIYQIQNLREVEVHFIEFHYADVLCNTEHTEFRIRTVLPSDLCALASGTDFQDLQCTAVAGDSPFSGRLYVRCRSDAKRANGKAFLVCIFDPTRLLCGDFLYSAGCTSDVFDGGRTLTVVARG